ncbi:hypothetical protein MNB_SV-9-55 [hydrothermal vent metagenome]|uniref:Uncharacterized protein n=1 Tax=hydrothermal vent metagenome TaxID=652676 RepID=A0A1W1CFF6_9ZZZZ
MEVIFNATIKMNDSETDWYIELEDSETGDIKNCETIEIFEKNLEDMSEKYTGRLDEVRWAKDEDVSPFYLNEVRLGLMAMEEQINKEKEDAEAHNAKL